VLRPPTGDKNRVFLIDAMSFIFRAYHAMARQRPMSTKTGIPTAATYVFVNMLNKLRQDFSPQYLAAVYDLSGPTFRDEQAKGLTSVQKFDMKTQQFQKIEYLGYKANRKEMPADLAQQVPYISRALQAYRIPILSSQGFEADDVIGTLARQAAEQGHEVFVVSSDKDMLQLVNDHICVLNPPKDNLICDAAKVEEIVGVPPKQVIDVMALRGDSIDNIPGAPGIGDKGSVEIIKRFGSVEQALDRAAEIEKKSYRESLQNNRETVLLSKQLVTIDCDVPIELNLEEMRAQEPDVAACQALFKELEFTTLLRSVLPAAAPVDMGEVDYGELKSAEELKDLLAIAAQNEFGLAVAFELPAKTLPAKKNGTDDEEVAIAESPAEATGDLFASALAAEQIAPASKLGFSAKPGKAFNVEISGPIVDGINLALANAKLTKSIHDLKSALHRSAVSGTMLNGVEHDTLLYSYLLDPTYSSHSLRDLALRRFDLGLSDSLAQAADVIGRLAIALRKEVEAADLLRVYRDIDLPLVPVLMRMEHAGVKIDIEQLRVLSRRLATECDAKARDIHHHAGTEFNINSPKQLGDVLFNKLNLPKPIKYGKGKTISTAVDVLEELAQSNPNPVPRMVLEYRQLSKLKSTYVDALPVLLNPKTGRLHTTFNQAGTATGRLSSTNPNLQNIPIRTEQGREIRAAFIAEAGHVLLAADYSQIELRLLAHYSDDPLLTQAFRRGDDIHSLTASEVFGVPPMMIDAEHRRRAKAVNFGIVYGLSPFGLSQQLGIETKEAKTYIDNYFAKYTGVRNFIDRTLDEARKNGYVRTLFGRVRPIPDINSKNANMRGFADRTSVNTPLQGTAADLIKMAMIRIDEELTRRKLKTRMTLQVHDELVFEVPEAEVEEVRTLVCDKMENVYRLSVPLVVDVGVGKNWRDME
jgi:DNA polymerase-1